MVIATRGETIDPFVFHASKRAAFERAAAAGESHLLYANSPGGASATARRVAAFAAPIRAAASASGVEPGLLEGIVFLESGGRPDVVAGGDPAGAAGISQIVAGTGRQLLGMRIDVSASRRLTKQIAAAGKRGDTAMVSKLEAQRRRVDERFDPPRALAATGRYLTYALPKFGSGDFAVASYHMGVGNLADAIRGYVGPKETRLAAKIVRERKLTYAQLYFESTPFRHKTAYRRLAGLGDNSNTYYWRVLAARAIMDLYRRNPTELARLTGLEAGYGSAEPVLHPPGSTEVFADGAALKRARSRGTLAAVTGKPSKRHFTVDSASAAGGSAGSPALRPQALGLLYYLADRVHAISHAKAPLTVVATVQAAATRQALAQRRLTKPGYSASTTGYSFDIARRYAGQAQAEAFQAMLDRLQALNVIAWERRPGAIHITVSKRAQVLTPLIHGAALSADA
ncbi:MAG: hypothetical protein M3Z33_00695 [Actinomycetota bacterium]|nr:hypothetical protein [Actinomycetota bacterium]